MSDDRQDNNVNQTKASVQSIENELNLLIRALDIKREEFCERINLQLTEIDKRIKNLAAENVLLHAVPQKLSTEIQEIVPQIALELDNLNQEKLKILTDNYRRDNEANNDAIKAIYNNLDRLGKDIIKFDQKRKGRYFLGLIMSMCISCLVAAGSTLLVLEYYPTKISLSNNENITILRSDVSVWGAKRLTVNGKAK